MKVKVTQSVGLFATPWTIQSIEFSRPEYWSGSCSLLLGIFPAQRSNQVSLIAGGFFTSWTTREAQFWTIDNQIRKKMSPFVLSHQPVPFLLWRPPKPTSSFLAWTLPWNSWCELLCSLDHVTVTIIWLPANKGGLYFLPCLFLPLSYLWVCLR